MGHQRLGQIPKTQKWRSVVEKLTGGGGLLTSPGAVKQDAPKVAAELLRAAEGGLQQAIDDRGLQYTVYLLTQLVLAARQVDWQQALDPLGIKLSEDATVFDLTAEVQSAIEADTRKAGRPSTVSQLAQQAACESLAQLTRDQAASLFESGREELQQAVRKLSTKAGFSDLGQRFFGNFMARYLDFYASKILPNAAGTSGFDGVQDFSEFKQSLFTHCQQSARIVHDFSGEWYSKTEWERGIDLQNSRGYLAVALEKLRNELKQQREAL